VDAYGSFEADEFVISAQHDGIITDFAVEEGASLSVGQYIASIDTTALAIQKQKISLQIEAFWTQYTTVPKIFRLLNDSLSDVRRGISAMGIIDDHASEQLRQIRDSLLDRQQTLEEAVSKQKASFSASVRLSAMQVEQLYLQLYQLNDILSKCVITSPVNGVVASKYVNRYELTTAGYPLVRIADLSGMTLKVYVTEDQLSSVILGSSCSVYIDEENNLKKYAGTVTWISSEPEFTPKMIQTRKERVNLVYAVKIKVENDGSIKTGMPGEVVFGKTSKQSI
jgi:HlyD family secretion protein